MTETGISHSTPPVLTTIPIAVIPIIDAGTASLSPFQQTTKIVHDHAGIGVHVRLESAFTMRWKPRSRSTGICIEGYCVAHDAGILAVDFEMAG